LQNTTSIELGALSK